MRLCLDDNRYSRWWRSENDSWHEVRCSSTAVLLVESLPDALKLRGNGPHACCSQCETTRECDSCFILHINSYVCQGRYVTPGVCLSLCYWLLAMASPGFIGRRGKAGDYVMGHSRRTSGTGAAAARWLIVLWLMQYWSKELWVVDICTS